MLNIEIFATQKSCFENAKVKGNTFYFAIDKGNVGKKEYGSCKDLETFLEFYKDYEPKHFYEILAEGNSCFEYYDIDLKVEQNEHNKTPEQIFMRFHAIREEFVGNCFKNIGLADWRITDSSKMDESGRWKISLHLVNRNNIFEYTEITQSFYYQFEQYVRDYYGRFDLFDKCVSSKNRAMRMILSTKASDKKRPLQQAIWKHGQEQIPIEEFFIQTKPKSVLGQICSFEVKKFEELKEKQEDEDDKNRKIMSQAEEKLVKTNLVDTEDDETECLIQLITEQIKKGVHSLCDNKTPYIEYSKFRNLCFAYLSTFKTEDYKEDQLYNFILTEIWVFYRSKESYNPENVINCIINASRPDRKENVYNKNYSEYTVKSLHYWARENTDYEKHFEKRETKISNGLFNEDENFFWGDFCDVLLTTIFQDYDSLVKYVLENFNKVCVIIIQGSPIFCIKCESPIKSYVFKQETFIKLTCKYTGKKGEETEKLSTILEQNLSVLKRHNSFMYKPFGVNYLSQNPKIFNTYNGMKAKLVSELSVSKCSKILNHIKEVLCANDNDKYEYFLTWLSHIVQYPEKKTKIMMILYSDAQQPGKGIIAEKLVESVFGVDNSFKTNSINDMLGDFNGLTSNKIFAVIDEVNGGGDLLNNNKIQKLKSLITDQFQTINKKYFEAEQNIDYLNFMMLTNESNAMKIESSDKRTCVFKVSDHRVNDRKYFIELTKELEDSECINHFYTFLYQYKSKRNILDIPQTKEREEMKNLTAEQPIKFFNDVRNKYYEIDERMISRKDGVWISCENFYQQFNTWVERTGEKQGIYSLIKFNKFVKNEFGEYKFFNTDNKRKFNVEKILPNAE